METDQKIRYGLMGLTAAGVVLASLGVRLPLDVGGVFD